MKKNLFQVRSTFDGTWMTYFVGTKEECQKYIDEEFVDNSDLHRDIYSQTLYKNAQITRATEKTTVDERLISND
jgi:hypothetical protein